MHAIKINKVLSLLVLIFAYSTCAQEKEAWDEAIYDYSSTISCAFPHIELCFLQISWHTSAITYIIDRHHWLIVVFIGVKTIHYLIKMHAFFVCIYVYFNFFTAYLALIRICCVHWKTTLKLWQSHNYKYRRHYWSCVILFWTCIHSCLWEKLLNSTFWD